MKTACLPALALLLAACEKEASVTGITVDKESLSLVLGYNEQITVNPVPSNADVDTRTYQWSSDNEAVATVTPFGIVHSVDEGSCNITVQHESYSIVIPVTVIDPVVLPPKKGHWLFDDASDLLLASVGNPLAYGKGSGDALECPTDDRSGFAPVAGPSGTNGAVRIGSGYFFRAAHGLTAPGLPMIPEYTLMIDFRIPALDAWYTFFQTDLTNGSDGEVFINKSGSIGVGSTGYSSSTVTAGVWHRFVVSGKYGEWYNYYLDGVLIHSVVTSDERFGLDLSYVLLLADNDGDDAEIDVSEIAIWQEALDDSQVKKIERTNSKLR